MNGSTDWKDYWLKGKENLDAARWALEKKQYNVCASRAYYAVFLASIAALIKLTSFRPEGKKWQHMVVQTELGRQLIVRKKTLSSEFRRILIGPDGTAALGRLQTRIHFCTRSKERLGSGAPVFV